MPKWREFIDAPNKKIYDILSIRLAAQKSNGLWIEDGILEPGNAVHFVINAIQLSYYIIYDGNKWCPAGGSATYHQYESIDRSSMDEYRAILYLADKEIIDDEIINYLNHNMF